MLRWADERGLAALGELDEEAIRVWMNSWTCRSSTTRQRLAQITRFFGFAVELGWAPGSAGRARTDVATGQDG